MAGLHYIDLGLKSPREFWTEVVLVDRDQFTKAPNARHAIAAAGSCWHLHDWLWHEIQTPKLSQKDFQDDIVGRCPQLGWIRDVADAGKHRWLNRPTVTLKNMQRRSWGYGLGIGSGSAVAETPVGGDVRSGLTITLDDGTWHSFRTVLERAVGWWQRNYFTP